MDRKLTPKQTLTAVAAALMVATAPAFADHERDDDDDDRRYRDRTEYARVISSKPIYRQVRVSVPREECHEERVVYRDPPRRDGGVLLGAIIGGVAGHQFGSGRGNAAATAAGALIGASVAQDRHYRQGVREHVSYEPVCVTRTEHRYEDQVEGYDVAYKLHGRVYHTRLPYDPGRRIAVNVDVRPVRSY